MANRTDQLNRLKLAAKRIEADFALDLAAARRARVTQIAAPEVQPNALWRTLGYQRRWAVNIAAQRAIFMKEANADELIAAALGVEE